MESATLRASPFAVLRALLALLVLALVVLPPVRVRAAAPAPENDFQIHDSAVDAPACRHALSPRLRPGAYAVVQGAIPNLVRLRPRTNAAIVGSLPPGTTVLILVGPRCANGMYWYKIGVDEPTMTGWTSEGRASEGYYLAPEPTQRVCPRAYPSPLSVGTLVHVIDNKPNNLRSQPRIGDNIIGQLAIGVPVEITDGPRCANRMVWWFVESADNNVQGWTAEGNRQRYWLARAPQYD